MMPLDYGIIAGYTGIFMTRTTYTWQILEVFENRITAQRVNTSTVVDFLYRDDMDYHRWYTMWPIWLEERDKAITAKVAREYGG